MIRTRRITFQLTPLLDLLLIVIFAQYMEMEQVNARTKADVREQSLRSASRLKQDTERVRAELRDEHQQRLAAVRQQREENDRKLADMVSQQEEVGRILAQLFDVPPALLDQTLRPRNPAQARSTEDTARLRRRFQQLRDQQGRNVIRHVLKYAEVSKHCDVWEVYIDDYDNIEFSSGSRSRRFRCESRKEFEEKLFENYKAFDQAKRLVVILVSYGDAMFGVRKMVIDGMPGGIDRMRRDRGQENWFEFAVLGFSPEGPTLRER